MKWFHRDRMTLAGAIETFGLARWTILVFAGLALAPALAVALRGGTGVPWPLGVVLLAISVGCVVADEFFGALPSWLLGLVGLGALTPIVLAGGDRLVLAIAWVLVMQATAFGSIAESVVVLGAAIGLTVVAGAVDPGLPSEPFVMGALVAAWFAGSGAREILRLLAHMRETERLLADEVARDERRKLAREVHDVIAHSMTVTLLHVNGARLALRAEPETADQALQRAERVGRASLEDLRRTVQLLSDTADPTLGTSVDLSDDLERLREGFSGGDTEVVLRVNGDAESVPPFVALTVFRIVQESLTNAVRHARGSCVRIAVDVDDERIGMRIENSMGDAIEPNTGAGRGLRGMFERASLIGGHLEAGPTKDGWLVNGWVPRGLPPAGLEA
jgi:signal transduction histidine kinase